MKEMSTYFCRLCNRGFQLEAGFRREGVCPHCGGYLHCCRNCDFFAGATFRGCREPQAEEVRDKDMANFCGFFCWSGGRASSAGLSDESAKARSKFESLFRNRPEKGQLQG